MIVGLSIGNYRALKQVANLKLGRFHVLVGPNASGKTTFLDALDLIRDCLWDGPRPAIEARAPEFRDLTHMRGGGELQVELWLDLAQSTGANPDRLVAYRLALESDDALGVRIAAEELCAYAREAFQPGAFPGQYAVRASARRQRLVGKTSKGTDFYTRENGKYQDTFTFGAEKLTLAMTPADEERYPTANAVKRFLMQGVRYVQLNSRAMRQPCPATRPTELDLDGTNLARVVGRLRQTPGQGNGPPPDPQAMNRWTQHLRYALPDLREIGWQRREADNAEYVVLEYEDGLKCPSWLASDGTLRMLALTLPAFLPPTPGIYMVEEPENGVHPMALDIIIRSLSTIPAAQVLVATHSPLVVAQVGREPLLCFARDPEGATITPGASHPALRDWDGTPDLAAVFAAGILG